eukprot:COSAG02_NODE_999_length_15328_cov_8.086360_10_plen_50_part_00
MVWTVCQHLPLLASQDRVQSVLRAAGTASRLMQEHVDLSHTFVQTGQSR